MNAPLAIVAAMLPELAPFEAHLTDVTEYALGGGQAWLGRLGGTAALLVRLGVGKVNAAAITALMLDRFQPRAVICTGIAGGIAPELAPGDVVIGTRTVQHDYGRWYTTGFLPMAPLTLTIGERHPAFWDADTELLRLAHEAAARVTLQPVDANHRPPLAISGVIASGDVFAVARSKKAEIHDRFGAHACEMESAAIAQICWQSRVPFLAIRGISDVAEDIEAPPAAAAAIAAANAASVVRAMVAVNG